jgi:hypothetical protein
MNKIGGRIGKLTVKRTSSIFLLISFVASTTTASVNETPPDSKRGCPVGYSNGYRAGYDRGFASCIRR